MFDNFDWSDAGQVAALVTVIGAIGGFITVVGKVGVDIITAAVNRNTQAIERQTVSVQAADAIKVEAMQRTLEATPGTQAITPATLPPAPQLQNPEVREAAVKLLGTGSGATPRPTDEELRQIIREEIFGIVNEERATANPDRVVPRSP